MFDELVSISGVRAGVTRRQSLMVAVFDDASDDPIGDAALDSESETISCVARAHDWSFIRDSIVRGDLVKRADGRDYLVTSIAHDSAMGWLIKARRRT